LRETSRLERTNERGSLKNQRETDTDQGNQYFGQRINEILIKWNSVQMERALFRLLCLLGKFWGKNFEEQLAMCAKVYSIRD